MARIYSAFSVYTSTYRIVVGVGRLLDLRRFGDVAVRSSERLPSNRIRPLPASHLLDVYRRQRSVVNKLVKHTAQKLDDGAHVPSSMSIGSSERTIEPAEMSAMRNSSQNDMCRSDQ